MVEVRYNKLDNRTLFGNNMFQYCLGRILAQELGYALAAESIPFFPNTAERVEGARHDALVQQIGGQIIDLKAITEDRSPRRLVVEGWFQRSEYYHPYRSQIREWLKFDPSVRRPATRPEVVVHVRRTDYVNIGWALPFSFYEAALTKLLPNGGDIFILTDDPGDPFFRQFKKWRPQFPAGSAIEDLLFLTQARRIVMSQSTFSWWATFLGDPEEVICPLPAFGAWAPDGEAREATLVERDRFTCLPCPDPYRMSGLEKLHFRRRTLPRRFVKFLNQRWGLSLPEPRHS